MNEWILVFLLRGRPNQPAASGPHSLEVCLEMVATQRDVFGTKNAYCYNIKTRESRKP